MQIVHNIDTFLYSLFEVPEGEIAQLVESIKRFYTVQSVEPFVTKDGATICVSIDLNKVYVDSQKYNKLISLCEQREFQKAYPIVLELCQKNNSNSDLFRIKGQIETELGDTERAIDSLIDALRWNPKNTYALIMMGNIFARDKNDFGTAMKYFHQATVSDPDDNISLNNIAANLMMLGKVSEAKEFFKKAEQLDDTYPNTKYGLASIAFSEGKNEEAFLYVIQALKLNKIKDGLYAQSIDLAKAIAQNVNDSDSASIALETYTQKLESLTGKKIKIEKDPDIPTAAKVEFAENHNRDYHLVKYKPEYPGVIHLVLHELSHIELAEEARIAGHNMLFTSTKDHRIKFITDFENYAKFLQKKGYPETSIAGVINSLFDGLNRQVFNTPLDLFIEDRLYRNFPSLRPVQFISLYTLLLEGIDAVTRKDIVELTDAKIISISKIFNLVSSYHFYDLFPLDFTKLYKASSSEITAANKMYSEYNEYRNDMEPGEEYELVQNWGNDLNLSKYFELVPELEYRNSKDTAFELPTFDKIDEDTDANQKIEMHEFQEKHQTTDLNPAVMMFMVGALKYFKDIPKREIKKTAFEIATIGVNGINPSKKSGYKVPSIKDSNFSGYQMLAYYYVSWALSAPQLLPELQLPFDKEFESAKAFIKI